MAARPTPMLALSASSLPDGPQWSYEVKWDGYRALLLKAGDCITLISRREADLTRAYPAVVAAARTLHPRACLLDGEIVALDADGRPSFQALQHRSQAASFVMAYYAFDILELDGTSLLSRPLSERRVVLASTVQGSRVLLSEPLPGSPAQIEPLVRSFGLEGVVAKRLDSRYEPGQRSGAWLKVKFQQRQEFVVGGFRPVGSSVDALIVGYRDADQWLAAGIVRAGLTPRARQELFGLLRPIQGDACPFANLPSPRKGRWGEGITAEDMAALRWVVPELVVEVAFTEWTAGGSLRHAAFVGRRTDKAPHDVYREG
ncbi:MAG: non-homologous end-joining DNA ligase [Vicinamibacterales bacterium]